MPGTVWGAGATEVSKQTALALMELNISWERKNFPKSSQKLIINTIVARATRKGRKCWESI